MVLSCCASNSEHSLATSAEAPAPAACSTLKMASVTPAIAETTTTTRLDFALLRTISAAWRMRSALPSEVPPNFITTRFLFDGSKTLIFPLQHVRACSPVQETARIQPVAAESVPKRGKRPPLHPLS